MKNVGDLKVCMIVHSNYYLDARVRRYAEDLADKGAKVDIICLQEDLEININPKNKITLFPVNLARLYSSELNYLIEYGIAFTLYFFKLLFLYFKNHYQIIHVHNMPDFLVFTTLIPRLFGAYIILDVHDPMPEMYISKFNKSMDSTLVKLILLQEKLSINYSNAVIAANHFVKNILISRGISKNKISVIYNIPNSQIFDRQKYANLKLENHEHFTLICPGTIAPRYGLDIPIQALPALVKEIPQIRLQIIGKHTDHVEELRALAQKINVLDYVIFEPSVNLDQVPLKLIQSNVGIFTAHMDIYTELITPGKVLEYAVMGIPMVAVRSPVLDELFDDSAILFFEPENVSQFTECILKLFKDPSLGTKMVKKVDDICSQNKMFSNVLEAYYEIIEKI